MLIIVEDVMDRTGKGPVGVIADRLMISSIWAGSVYVALFSVLAAIL